MANTITLAQTYISNIQNEVFTQASKASVLNINDQFVTMSKNGKKMQFLKVALQGLAPFSRTGSYVAGDVTATWQEVDPGLDAGRSFGIDVMDSQEMQGYALSALSGQFVREKVAPYYDAYCFNAISSASSILGTAAALSTSAGINAAVRVAKVAMAEENVDIANSYLFITPTKYELAVGAASTEADREAMKGFKGVILVPQTRFYKGVTFYDGTTEGQTDGGYAKTSSTGRDINFMIVEPSALVQGIKHTTSDVVLASTQKDSDKDWYKYRVYGYSAVLDNRVKGVYCHLHTS